MAKFLIQGGRRLHGEIAVAANKNAVLPMMAACLLTDDDCFLDNVPAIADVSTMILILRELGAIVEWHGEGRLHLNCSAVHSYQPSEKLVERLRASIVLMGPLLARFGRADMHHPGGDSIGTRSIGTHIRALERLGARFEIQDNFYSARADLAVGDRDIFLDEASVTATENAMLLAAVRPGMTQIRNAACEPHVMNLAAMLAGMGAEVAGAGTNIIRVCGARGLRGGNDKVWPDHVEAGTFAALAAACGGTVTIRNVIPDHLDMVMLILDRMGVQFRTWDGNMEVKPSTLHATSKIQTGVWPAFPTDLASIFIVLATQAQGMTLVHDWMYEGRMFFIDKLVQMGANVVLADPHRAVVSGVSSLRGREFVSPDIRAGIALVVAALVADGESRLDHIELIDRGYECIDARLRALGADICRIDESSSDAGVHPPVPAGARA